MEKNVASILIMCFLFPLEPQICSCLVEWGLLYCFCSTDWHLCENINQSCWKSIDRFKWMLHCLKFSNKQSTACGTFITAKLCLHKPFFSFKDTVIGKDRLIRELWVVFSDSGCSWNVLIMVLMLIITFFTFLFLHWLENKNHSMWWLR